MKKLMFLLAIGLAGAVALAGDLVVGEEGLVQSSSLTIDGMTVNGNLTVDSGAVLTGTATPIDGSFANATTKHIDITFKDDGRVADSQKLTATVGAGGGTATFVSSKISSETKATYFRLWTIDANAGVTALEDGTNYFDAARLEEGGCLRLDRIVNSFSSEPVRFKFAGGRLYFPQSGDGFSASRFRSTQTGGHYVMESVDGKPIQFDVYAGASQFCQGMSGKVYFETRGTGDFVFKGSYCYPNSDAYESISTLNPACGQDSVNSRIQYLWNHTGDFRLQGTARWMLNPSWVGDCATAYQVIPSGPNTGDIYLEGVRCVLDMNGCKIAQRVNSIYMPGGASCCVRNGLSEGGGSSYPAELDFGYFKPTCHFDGTVKGDVTLNNVGTGTFSVGPAKLQKLKCTGSGDIRIVGEVTFGSDNYSSSLAMNKVKGDRTSVIRQVGAATTLTLSGETVFGGTLAADAGTLALAADFAASDDLQAIEVAEGATLALANGAVIRAGSVTVRGVRLEGGVDYTGEDSTTVGPTKVPGLTGNGVIRAAKLGTDGIWSNGGADNLVTTEENWLVDHVPDLLFGSSMLKFATAGSSAEFPGDASVKGVTFDLTGGQVSFELKSAQGNAGSLTLGGEGVSVVGSESVARTAAIRLPTTLASSQTWDVASNATLDVSGAISGLASTALSKTGKGVLAFSGANAGYAGSVIVSGGAVRLDGVEFGATPISVYPTVGDTTVMVSAADDSHNVLNGLVLGTRRAGETQKPMLRISAGNLNARTELKGGLEALYGLRFSGEGMVELHAPIHVEWGMSGSGHIVFCDKATKKMTVSNTSGVYEFEADDALCGGMIQLNYTGAGLILNGHPQTTESFVMNNLGEIASSTPAQLTVKSVAADNPVCRGAFTGGAGLRYEATSTMTFDRQSSTSTGVVDVVAGTLAFTSVFASGKTWTPGWENGTVNVCGGTLDLGHSTALGSNVVLKVTSGTIRIADGVKIRVKEFWVDGKLMTAGTYRKANCPYIEGNGSIKFGDPGLVLVLR